MAFNVNDKVRVADQSSSYRTHRGVVKSVSGSLHQVRIDGHGCKGRVPLVTGQLKIDTTSHPTSYAQC